MILRFVDEYRRRVEAATREAHKALSVVEGAGSRCVLLEDLTKSLADLPLDVQDYFSEALECLQLGMRRAPIVFSWAGFFSVFSSTLHSRHEGDVRVQRPKWKFTSLEELTEAYPESQILDVAKDVGFIGKGNLRKYQGQLSERNQCAHPTLYKPTLNVAIGYLDQMIRQTSQYM